MNNCCLVGKLTRAPVVRFEGDGMQTASFTLAVEELSREGKPFTLYVPCTSWGKSAEAWLVAAHIPPALGASAWSKRLADRVLVLGASQARAVEESAPNSRNLMP
jgi:hypothetical protein